MFFNQILYITPKNIRITFSAKGWLLFFCLVLFPFISIIAACSEPSPIMQCAAVQANGNVTISWKSISPSGSFNSYHIYTSTSSTGPFTVLDSVFTASQSSYTHVGANANVAQVYYFINTRCADNNFSSPSDTINTLHLTVNNPGSGTAQLSWKPIVADTQTRYTVLKESPVGVWTIAGTINNPAKALATLNYTDTILVCNATINYRVETKESSGCNFVSSVAGGVFQNKIVPNIPLFDTVSVNDNNKVVMSWNVNPAVDVQGYVIYKYNGASWIAVDSVLGKNTVTFTDTASGATSAAQQYRLAAYDSCNNISPQSTMLSSMFLSATADICDRSATLSWTPYTGFGTTLSGYRIYRSSTGISGPYSLVGSVGSTELTYIAAGLAASTTYYFKVQAVKIGGAKTASSNRITFYSATPVPPKFLYIQNVSVASDNQVEITCHVDITSVSKGYAISRADSLKGPYVQIGTVDASGVSPVVFTDKKADAKNQAYYYRVTNIDSCGNKGLQSTVSNTIFLKVKSEKDSLRNQLTWNNYGIWLGGVITYNIYRQIEGVGGAVLIASVATGTNTYTDDVSGIKQGQGVFIYYIEAVEGSGNPYGFTETSLSNEAKGFMPTKIYVPNAFSPDYDSKNDEFKPVGLYVDFSGYQMRIFNRKGLQLFSSENIDVGWDGTFKGKECELGVYVYTIQYKTSWGEYIDINGTFTLLR